jgi:hypothetical protein
MSDGTSVVVRRAEAEDTALEKAAAARGLYSK